MGGRVYALLPGRGRGRAHRWPTGSGRQALVGVSSHYSDPADVRRALEEAELVLGVQAAGGGPPGEEIGGGTYRLLFRVLASHPEEVKSFYEDTIAPLVRYDEQYSTDLVGTLESYLGENCNMNATAAAIHAHRHTVSYRLERVKELSGLDPFTSEDRERLGLGLKAYRIIEPQAAALAQPQDQRGDGDRRDHEGCGQVPQVVRPDVEGDGDDEVAGHPDRGGHAERGPGETDDQPGRARQKDDRQVVELVLRHAHPGVGLDDLRLVAELPDGRERQERRE